MAALLQRCFKLKQWTSGQQKLPQICLSPNYELLIFAEQESVCFFLEIQPGWLQLGGSAKTITMWPWPKIRHPGKVCKDMLQLTWTVHPQFATPKNSPAYFSTVSAMVVGSPWMDVNQKWDEWGWKIWIYLHICLICFGYLYGWSGIEKACLSEVKKCVSCHLLEDETISWGCRFVVFYRYFLGFGTSNNPPILSQL